jgi:hypothetical protein
MEELTMSNASEIINEEIKNLDQRLDDALKTLEANRKEYAQEMQKQANELDCYSLGSISRKARSYDEALGNQTARIENYISTIELLQKVQKKIIVAEIKDSEELLHRA